MTGFRIAHLSGSLLLSGLLIWLGGAWPFWLIAGAFLMQGSWLIFRVTPATAPAVIETVEVVDQAPPSNLEDFLEKLLPLWNRHIELAKTQTGEAADELSEQFVRMKNELEKTIALSGISGDNSVITLISVKRSTNSRKYLPRWRKARNGEPPC